MSADALFEWTPADASPREKVDRQDYRRENVSDARLDRAIRLVARAGLRNIFDEWIADYRNTVLKSAPGGRPAALHAATVFTLFLVLAMEGRPLHLNQVASIIYSGLSEPQQQKLGLRVARRVSADQWYDRTRRAWEGLRAAIDPFPQTGGHRPTVAERAAAEAVRDADPHTPVRAERLHQLANMIIEATLHELPAQYRPGSYTAVYDATPVPVFGRGVARERKEKLRPHEKLSSEPDAGFYARTTESHADDPSLPLSKVKYAYELDLLVGIHPDPDKTAETPVLALGVAQHRPGADTGPWARKVLENVLSRGHIIEEYVADRLYLPGATVENLQGYLFDKGIRVVMDYKSDQFGVQAQHKGMIQVDGRWYSPSLPEELRNLGKDWYKAKRAWEAAIKRGQVLPKPDFTERFEVRAMYEFRPKEKTDAKGNTPMMCPAVGPGATLTCPLKAFMPANVNLFPVLSPPEHPGPACTNKSSISVPRDADNGKWLKYRQDYAYGTAEWQKHYNRRNVVESFNQHLKSGAHIGLDIPARRRMQGAASKFLLTTFAVAAGNLIKIDNFLAERETQSLDALLTGTDAIPRRSASRKSNRREQLEHRRRGVEGMMQRASKQSS
ncbi:hypothetical protein [Microbacterium sp. NPDC096154]|uniref:hypothetical protein n=1 Tax=Microbacterium sp. NPDC096154 TaxID=3155549 RepID=UPI00332A52CE